jgi:zinc/manganese transport system ATP-binding protein
LGGALRSAAATGAACGAIRLLNLTLGYERRPAAHHLTGAIARGELLAVCGPNGAGKSTLLKGLAGLLAPLDGAIDRGGLACRDMAYLPQQSEIDRSFPITVAEFAALGAVARCGLFGRIGGAERARVAGALEAVGLAGFEARGLDTLSGGQMQRAMFARLIVEDSPVILMDEPFTALDEPTVDDLLRLVRRWSREGRTVVAVLHDFELIRRAFPKTLLLAREIVAWGDTHAALTPETLAKARGMSEAYDLHAQECRRVAAAAVVAERIDDL